MRILVNGESVESQATTVKELLAERGLASDRVVVELNGDIVPREAQEKTPLAAGDTLEIVQFVGGG